MPFDPELAARLRSFLGKDPGVVEKAMFGGIAVMVRGRMALGVLKEDLVVRVAAEDHDRFVAEHGARAMDFTGRPMRGFLYVAPEGTRGDADLAEWVARALAYNATEPAKAAKKPARKSAKRPAKKAASKPAKKPAKRKPAGRKR